MSQRLVAETSTLQQSVSGLVQTCCQELRVSGIDHVAVAQNVKAPHIVRRTVYYTLLCEGYGGIRIATFREALVVIHAEHGLVLFWAARTARFSRFCSTVAGFREQISSAGSLHKPVPSCPSALWSLNYSRSGPKPRARVKQRTVYSYVIGDGIFSETSKFLQIRMSAAELPATGRAWNSWKLAGLFSCLSS